MPEKSKKYITMLPIKSTLKLSLLEICRIPIYLIFKLLRKFHSFFRYKEVLKFTDMTVKQKYKKSKIHSNEVEYSNFQPPIKKFILFKPLCLWYFVIAAQQTNI